jgi:hypothetical protein
MFLQALEIIFEVQRKKSNEKITRKKIGFPTYKNFFFFLRLFEPLLFSNLITFLFFIHFKQSKIL